MAVEAGGGGTSTEQLIAEAAIKAAMEHRGFSSSGGGEYYKQEFRSKGSGEGVHPQYQYWVRKGSVRIERSPNPDNSDFSAEEASLKAELDADVFNYWPGAIDDLFRKWQEEQFPSWGGFAISASYAAAGADELNPGTTFNKDGTDLKVGNTRLSADLTNLHTRTGELEGQYAEAFHERYVTPLPPVLQGQYALTSVLAIALEAERTIWLSASRDIGTLKSQARTAMEASGPKAGGGGVDAKVLITVFGAVLAGIAAVATAGGSVAVTAALASAGAGAVSNLMKDAPKKAEQPVRMGADTPEGVLKKIQEALDELNRGIRGEEEHVQKILRAASGLATEEATKGHFDLKGMKAEGEVLGPQQNVTVDAGSIAKITAQWIPCIAGDLLLARSNLGNSSAGSWSRPSGVGLGDTGPYPDYDALEDIVIELLTNTAAELSEGGQALLAAARGLGLADQAEQEKYLAIAKRITDANRNTPE